MMRIAPSCADAGAAMASSRLRNITARSMSSDPRPALVLRQELRTADGATPFGFCTDRRHGRARLEGVNGEPHAVGACGEQIDGMDGEAHSGSVEFGR